MRNGFERTLHWAGFHAAIVVAAAIGWWHDKRRWQFLAWLVLSAVAVAAGGRFFSRYFFQILPVAVIGAAAFHPAARAGGRQSWWCSFWSHWCGLGPQYVDLFARGPAPWRDVAMDQDSRAAALIARKLSTPGDTIQVWGFGGTLCLHRPALRQPLSRFAALDRRTCRPAPQRFEGRSG